MSDRLTMKASAYYALGKLIENNTIAGHGHWFIHKDENLWAGATEEEGRIWAREHNIEIEFVEPLGSEPELSDDEEE